MIRVTEITNDSVLTLSAHSEYFHVVAVAAAVMCRASLSASTSDSN